MISIFKNSIFTFGDNHGFRIHSIDSENFKIAWKMYHSNVTLILIEQLEPIDSQVYFKKLDLLFDAMVLMYGLDDLLSITSEEKFKREIKVSFKILDAIMQDSHHSSLDLFGGYMTDCVDSIVVNEHALFQQVLNSSCIGINSSYACLMYHGRIITASAAWWDSLKPIESHLISLLCLSLSESTCRDVPIYLPHKNPHQPLRLLTYSLTKLKHLTLCFICSEKPTVDSVEPIVKNLWHPVYNSLINLSQYVPRNFANSLTLDQNMIAYINNYCIA